MDPLKKNAEYARRILVALDLTLPSGREHQSGFYNFADAKSNWEIRIGPNACQPLFSRETPHRYSYRRQSIGFSLEAR